MEKEQKRLVALMPVDLIDQVDEYAAQLHINRTAAVNVLITRALQYERVYAALPQMMQAYQDLQNQATENVDQTP